MFFPEYHDFLKITKTSDAYAPIIKSGASVILLKLKMEELNTCAFSFGPDNSANPAIKTTTTKVNKKYFLRLKISIFTYRKRTCLLIYFRPVLLISPRYTRKIKGSRFSEKL